MFGPNNVTFYETYVTKRMFRVIVSKYNKFLGSVHEQYMRFVFSMPLHGINKHMNLQRLWCISLDKLYIHDPFILKYKKHIGMNI